MFCSELLHITQMPRATRMRLRENRQEIDRWDFKKTAIIVIVQRQSKNTKIVQIYLKVN